MLLSLRGRLRGVAGVLRRTGQFVEPRLQRYDAGVLDSDMGGLCGDPFVRQEQPSGQRCDQRVRFGVSQLGGNREPGHPMCRIDSLVTVSRNFRG